MAEQNPNPKVEKIEGVEKVGTASKALDIPNAEEIAAPTKAKFDDALVKADTKWDQSRSQQLIMVASDDKTPKLSPIAEMSINEKRIERLKPVSIDQVVKQAQDTQDKLRTARTAVENAQNTPNFRLSPAHDAILTDKLIHIDTSIRTTLAKVGVEIQAHEISSTGPKPLQKFLNYLTNGDKQINSLADEISALNTSKERLTPEKLLAVQIKLGFVQQQLEFFTNVLNKAVEGTKTIMNVQV